MGGAATNNTHSEIFVAQEEERVAVRRPNDFVHEAMEAAALAAENAMLREQLRHMHIVVSDMTSRISHLEAELSVSSDGTPSATMADLVHANGVLPVVVPSPPPSPMRTPTPLSSSSSMSSFRVEASAAPPTIQVDDARAVPVGDPHWGSDPATEIEHANIGAPVVELSAVSDEAGGLSYAHRIASRGALIKLITSHGSPVRAVAFTGEINCGSLVNIFLNNGDRWQILSVEGSRDRFAFRSAYGCFLSVDTFGRVSAKAREVTEACVFAAIELGMSKFAFLTYQGRYLSSNPTTKWGRVAADQPLISRHETFDVQYA